MKIKLLSQSTLTSKKEKGDMRERSQRLRVFAVFAEDLGFLSSTHIVAYNHCWAPGIHVLHINNYTLIHAKCKMKHF